MKKIPIFISILLVSLLGCGPDLEQKTMTVHDEAMKDIAIMNRLGRNLKKELAELDSTDTNRKAVLVNALAQIDKADQGMTDWMRNYKMPSGSADEVKQYLEKQLSLIQQNKNDIESAIKSAEQIIKK